MKAKRILALCLSLCMLLTMMPAVMAASPQGFVDFPTGWSNEAMTAAVNNGLLVGKSETEIKPQDNLTRAEFATIVTRAFGAKTVADISAYTDVAQDAWYYEYIAKAVKMEAMQGKSANSMDPEANITREEAFTALARVLVLESNDYSSLSKFKDASDISDWAKPYLSAMAAKNYVNGDEMGYANPKANITREEFAQVMHNMIKRYITNPGTYAEVLPGITVVRCGGVTVTGTVQGDLVIGDGAMTDAINLTNVTIGGRLLTRGGTMTLKTATTGEGVVVKNVNGVTQFRNYRTESVFAGIRELTQAEFLKVGGSFGSVHSGGGTSTETLKFYVDDELYETIKVKYGSIIGDKLPDAPTKEGYTFKGWYNNDDEEIGKDTEVKNSFEVYAVWEAKTYELKFNPDNGDPIITLTGTYDKAIGTLPTEPTKAGYTFGGWVDENGNPVDEFTVVKGAMQITAKWNPIPPQSFAIVFKVDGATYENVIVTEGDAIGTQMPADPTKTGYTFEGWEDENGNPVTSATVVTGNVIVNAVFSVNEYTLTFDPDNGDTPFDILVTFGQAIGAQMPADPTKVGFTFMGWEDQNGNPVNAYTVVTEDMQIIAIWEVVPAGSFSVTFKVDGTTYETIIVTEGDAIGAQMPADPTKTGYTFEGWEDENGNPVTDATVVTDNMIVNAVFTANEYTLTFDPDNGDAPFDIFVTYGDAIGSQMPSNPVKSGWTFAGWEDQYGNPVDATTIITEDLQITATWELIVASSFTVTFKVDGSDYATITVTDGDAIGAQMPADPTKAGYTFEGWVDENGNPVDASTIVTEDLQVNAVWEIIPAATYTVTFKVDGADYATITVTDGDAIGAQMPADPTKTGYTFEGWVDENGNPVTDATAVTDNMVVNAVFTANEYTLTFDPDNSDAPFDVYVTYGEAIGAQMPADPTKAGYTFEGWEDQYGNPVDATTIVTEDLQIVAIWEVIPAGSFSVIFKVDGVDYATITVTDGDAIGTQMPADPTKTGYTFEGWEDENGNPVTDATVVTDDMIVNAVFEAIQITVEFKVDSAAATPIWATLTRDYGWTLADTDVTAPTLAGYEFQGWIFYDGTPVEYGVTQFTENVTLYAKWTPGTVNYTVKHNVQKIDGTYEIITERKTGTTGTLTSAEAKAEYAASHDVQSFSQVTIQADGSTVVEIYYNRNQYTVTFDPANGEATFDIAVVYGDTIGAQMPADPTYAGYAFMGWEDQNGNAVTSATVITDDLTVTAQWELIPVDSFTVTFKVDGETYETIIVSDGDAIDAQMPADPTKTGYTFLYWEDEDGNVVDASYVVTENVIATAVFEIEIYTVRFFNGAEAVDAKQLGDALDVEYNNNVALSEYPADAILAAENVKAYGYTKKADWADFYNNEKHEVYAQWMYVNPASGEWELFDENVNITQDTDVHLLLKRVFFMIENDRLPQAFQVQAHYVDGRDGVNPDTEATRLRETGKDLTASFIKQTELLMGEEFFLENEAKIFNKLAEKGILTENREILLSKLPVKITTVISVEKIEGEVKQYIEDSLADPAKLDSVLAMVDIEALINTIGMDAILDGLSDDTLYQLLTSSTNRTLVTNVIYDNLSNPAIKGEVVEYLKNQITASEAFRLELAAEVSSTLINSLSDAQLLSLMKGTLKDTVIDYVVTNATGTLKQTLIEFVEGELEDTTSDFYGDILTIIRTHLADDADLRKEILSNRVLLETMLDFFEDEVIEIMANSDELITNAISQDNVREQFLEELVESEHFMEEILAVHPEYLTKMVKDGGHLHLTAEDVLQTDAFKEDIFAALKADGEFANFFVAGSALENVVADYVDDEKEAILDYIVLGSGDYSDYDAMIDTAIASYGTIDELRDDYALLPPADQQDVRDEIWDNLRPEIIATAMESFTDDSAAGAAFAEQALTSIMAKYLDKDLPAGIDEDVIDNVFVNYVNDALHNTNLDVEIQNLIDSVKAEVKDLRNGPLADMTSSELVDFVITYRNDHPNEVYDVLHVSYQTVEDYVLNAITDETATTYDPDLYAAIDDMVADHASEVEDDVIISLIDELLGHNIDLLDRYIEMLLNNPTELRGYVTLFVESDSFDEAFVTENRAAIVGTLSVNDYADILLELASDTDPDSEALISDLVDEFVGTTDPDTILLIKDYIADFIENDLDVTFITENRATINTALVDADVSDLIDENLIKEYVADVNARGETEALANQVYDYLKDLQYYKDFIEAFKKNAEKFEVTNENAVFATAIANAVENYTYEQIIELVDNDLVDKILKVMGEDFLKSMFNTATSDYAKGLNEVVEDVKADGETRTYTTSIIFKANVIQMLNDLYVKAQLKAEEKLMSFPALRYDENVYLQYIVQHNPIEELLVKSGPETEELTGYKFKDAADTMEYLDYAQKMMVIADDALCFYGNTDYLTEAETEALFDAIYGKADRVQAKVNELLAEFEATGAMPAKVESVVNKVSKVNELLVRFEPQIDRVINLYLDSSLSDIGEDKPHKAYDILLGIEEPVLTVDFLYDLFYKAEDKAVAKLNEKIEDGTLEKLVNKYESTSIKQIVDKLGNEKASTYAEKLDEIKNSGRVQSAFDSLYDVVLMIADQGIDVFKAPANTNSKLVVVDAYQINIKGVKFTIQRDMR